MREIVLNEKINGVISFRKANKKDKKNLIEIYKYFYFSTPDCFGFERHIEDINKYFENYLETDKFLVLIGEKNNKIVTVCMGCIYNAMPTLLCENGKKCEIFCLYTLETERKKGYAEKIIKLFFEELKKMEVKRIFLNYTDEGFELYKKLGFENVGEMMKIDLK